MRKLVADVAIRLVIVISIIFILLSQGFDSGNIIFTGCLIIILCMAMVFFSFDKEEQARPAILTDLISYILFALIVYFNKLAFFYLPAIIYPIDLTMERNKIVLATISFFLYGLILGIDIFLILGLSFIAILFALLNTYIIKYNELQEDSYSQIDALRHINNKIKEEQNKLILLQDSAIKETRDAERKRITSEIHDSLGHDLSASIIQLAALEYQTEDEETKDQLKTIREILSSGMDDVRSAIHNEHSDSIDLKTEFEKQAESFTKADIKLTFNSTTDPNLQLKHSLINIVKEALANINKHSNAKNVKIAFNENNEDWILLITDDGDLIDTRKNQDLD